jgi:hypothetical protein
MNKSSKALLPCVLIFLLYGCDRPRTEPASSAEAEAVARTEFTDRIENFFEYEPLRAARPSQVRIHLTDLSDGSPVEKAEVTLSVRRSGGTESLLQTTAKVGKVTGIYVAELTIPQSGSYDIEFRIKNARLDERLPLTDFKVE